MLRNKQEAVRFHVSMAFPQDTHAFACPDNTLSVDPSFFFHFLFLACCPLLPWECAFPGVGGEYLPHAPLPSHQDPPIYPLVHTLSNRI